MKVSILLALVVLFGSSKSVVYAEVVTGKDIQSMRGQVLTESQQLVQDLEELMQDKVQLNVKLGERLAAWKKATTEEQAKKTAWNTARQALEKAKASNDTTPKILKDLESEMKKQESAWNYANYKLAKAKDKYDYAGYEKEFAAIRSEENQKRLKLWYLDPKNKWSIAPEEFKKKEAELASEKERAGAAEKASGDLKAQLASANQEIAKLKKQLKKVKVELAACVNPNHTETPINATKGAKSNEKAKAASALHEGYEKEGVKTGDLAY